VATTLQETRKREQILDRRRVAMLADDGNGRENGRRRHAAD
jgi:hypothetical protein